MRKFQRQQQIEHFQPAQCGRKRSCRQIDFQKTILIEFGRSFFKMKSNAIPNRDRFL